MEFGKDIIALSPGGELVALQLKGNPGSRLSVSQWKEILPQLNQLIAMPVPKGLTSGKLRRHQPILVTNGDVDEEVQHAIEAFNAGVVPGWPTALPLQIWTRGKLLELLQSALNVVWPASAGAQALALGLVAADGQSSIRLSSLQQFLQEALGWKAKLSKPQARERLSGSATLLAICKKPFVQAGNYFEVIKASSIFLGMLAGFVERNKLSSRKDSRIFSMLREDLLETVEVYSNWISEKFTDQPFVHSNILAEFGVYHPRKIMVMALAATSFLEKRRVGVESTSSQRQLLRRSLSFPFLIGESLIPPFLACFWAKEHVSAKLDSDFELRSVVSEVALTHLSKNQRIQLPGPYYDVDDLAKSVHREFLGRSWEKDIDSDSAYHRSLFGYPLFLLLVRRNWKVTAKTIWPGLSKVMYVWTELSDPNDFALPESESALEKSASLQVPSAWADVVASAQQDEMPRLPPKLAEDPVLVLLICLFLPYRMTREIVLWLDRSFARTWY